MIHDVGIIKRHNVMKEERVEERGGVGVGRGREWGGGGGERDRP